MKQWTRRGLLVGGAAIGLPVAGLALCKMWCWMRVESTAGLRQLLGAYPASAAARALGARYIALTKSSPLACFRRVECDERIANAIRTGCRTSMLAAVEEACREDFRCGRIHCIDGWILARTELDIAALSTI
jgi:hypothetical protein